MHSPERFLLGKMSEQLLAVGEVPIGTSLFLTAQVDYDDLLGRMRLLGDRFGHQVGLGLILQEPRRFIGRNHSFSVLVSKPEQRCLGQLT